MPITLPTSLPAFSILRDEGVMVMGRSAAESQDIRPLKIGLLNLMPKKIQTETQFARLIGASPLQTEFSLIRMSEHETKNTAAEHMAEFYQPFRDVRDQKFDGLIITGAPIEHLDFEDVTYWSELCEIFEWTQTNVHSTFGICWGGMAMINYFHGVKKHMLPAKQFGCYRHRNLQSDSPYLRGFSDDLVMPVSRWTEMRRPEIEAAGLPCYSTVPRWALPWSKIAHIARSISSTILNMTAPPWRKNINVIWGMFRWTGPVSPCPSITSPMMIQAKNRSTAGAAMPIFYSAIGFRKST